MMLLSLVDILRIKCCFILKNIQNNLLKREKKILQNDTVI